MRDLLYSLSPEFLCLVYQRIERSPLGYRLARGAFWSLAGSLISRGLGLAAAILVGRMLGAREYGQLGIIQNTIGMFGTLAGFGMGLTANKHVAEFKRTDPARAGRIIGLASATAWVSSSLMALALVASGPWLAANTLAAPELGRLLQAGSLLLLLSGVNGAQTGALSGFESFKAIARINLISGLATFPLMVLGAWRWGLAGAVWALIASQALNCILSYFAVRAEARPYGIVCRRRGSWRELDLFWRFSLPAVLTGLLNSAVAWGASALVVNQAGGYGDMGIYNAALRVKVLPETFLGMLIAPMLPVLSEAFARGDRATYRRALRFNFLLASLIIIPVSLLQAAAPRLTVLAFGAGYQGRLETVQWLMTHAVAFGLLFPAASILISMGEMWFSWQVNTLFAVLFGVSAWQLVPRYGAAGYAASLVLAYLIANARTVWFLYARLGDVMRFLRWGTLALAAGALLAICFWAGRQLSLPWGAFVGTTAAAAFLILKYRLHLKAIAG